MNKICKLTFEFNTILVIYDRLCPLFHTTNLLKDGCFSCICPSYDENSEVRALVSLFEHIECHFYMSKVQYNITNGISILWYTTK